MWVEVWGCGCVTLVVQNVVIKCMRKHVLEGVGLFGTLFLLTYLLTNLNLKFNLI